MKGTETGTERGEVDIPESSEMHPTPSSGTQNQLNLPTSEVKLIEACKKKACQSDI